MKRASHRTQQVRLRKLSAKSPLLAPSGPISTETGVRRPGVSEHKNQRERSNAAELGGRIDIMGMRSTKHSTRESAKTCARLAVSVASHYGRLTIRP